MITIWNGQIETSKNLQGNAFILELVQYITAVKTNVTLKKKMQFRRTKNLSPLINK